MTTERFKDFFAEPRQRPSELEQARMRRVLGGLPKGKAQHSPDAYADAVVTELRAVRSEMSSLRELLEGRLECGAPVHDEVLKRSEAAKLLGICTETLTKLVRDEKLPCKRVGKEYRFLRSEIVAWLAARGANELGDV
jgi:excisionase family DNA binding protein